MPQTLPIMDVASLLKEWGIWFIWVEGHQLRIDTFNVCVLIKSMCLFLLEVIYIEKIRCQQMTVEILERNLCVIRLTQWEAQRS